MGNKIAIVMAVLLGIGAVMLVRQYIIKQELAYRGDEVEVAVAAKSLQAGHKLEAKDIGRRKVPLRYWKVTGGVRFDGAGAVIGQPLVYSLKPGEFISEVMVDKERQEAEGIQVKNGLRAYSLAVGGVRGVSGLLVLGDRIDILGTFKVTSGESTLGAAQSARAETMYLMKDVEIKALDRRTIGAVRSTYSTVTFELSPLECLVLEFAQNVGEVKLVKRNRQDHFKKYEEDERIEVNKTNLMQFIKFAMRQRATKRSEGD